MVVNIINRKRLAFATSLICWFLSLILPHFQGNMTLTFVIFQIVLSTVLFLAVKEVLSHEIFISDLKAKLVLLAIIVIHFLSLFLVKIEISQPYILWNRFGSGTMLKNDQIFSFGDLAHLTTAASCSKQTLIGEILCDPFDRVFNQNPHVVEFMRLTHLNNLFILGVISTLLFYLSIFLIVLKFKRVRSQILTIIVSPPLILALDRGNEILTITFIIFGLYLISSQNKFYLVGYFLLGLSAVFKVWPIFLVFFILVINFKKLDWLAKILLSIPIIYWIIFYRNIVGMISFTQYRSPNGLSFGLRHYLNKTLEPSFLIAFVLFITLSFFYFLRRISMQSTPHQLLINLLTPLYLTYISIWISGIHFSYRLVILIPILFLLPVWEKSNICVLLVNSLIVTVFITARLSVTTALTALLALIFCILVLKDVDPNYRHKITKLFK